MANTATALAVIPARPGKSGPVRPYKIAIDTVDTDLTIHSPSDVNRVYVVGMLFSETSATNITFKYGSTTIVVPELAANQGVFYPVSDGFIFATDEGEDLIIRASVAITSLLIHIVEAQSY